MKILIATGLYPPDIGGPATYSWALNEHLPRHGVTVAVLPFSEVRRLPKIIRHFVYFLKVVKKGRGAEIIFAQDPVSVGLPAMFAAKLLRKKFILKIVGDYAWEQSVQRFGVQDMLDNFANKKYGWRVEFLRKIQRYVAESADKIIVPSEYLKKIVSTWIRRARVSKINVIYNSFDMSAILENKRELRENFGLSGKTLISIGRLMPWKGFKALVEIMPLLIEQIPDLKLFIIGEGPEQKNLKSQISNLKMDEKITFKDKLPKEELLRYLKASDIFVLNTGYEGLSHQILEAMAVITPVITTNVGGNPEIIESGKDGLLVEYNNKEELKQAILNLFSNNELRENFANNAREKVKQFSKEKMIKRTIEVFHNSDNCNTPAQGWSASGGKVLNISLDSSVLDKKSPVSKRAVLYAGLVDKYTVIAPDRTVGKISAFVKLYRQAKKILIGEKYDIITVQDQYYVAFLGWILARRFKICLHLQIHGFEKFSGLRKLIAKFVIPRADAVRCVSQRLKKELVSSFKIQVSKIAVVPIFIDIKKIQEAPIKTDLCKKYSQFDFVILMASRFSREKNIPLAIEMMKEIVGQYPKTGLIIVGDGPEREALKLQVASYKLQDEVFFESWTNDLISYYKTADLFLLTSNSEGYGMTLVEAAAAGCNVISSDVGVAPEILPQENIFEVGNKKQLKEKMIKAINGKLPQTKFGAKMPTKEEYLEAYKKSWEICGS